jgi:nucleotide-binding universal stress UspA family protein
VKEAIMKKILVPTDFSECSRAAFDQALAMAKHLGLEIELLHVFSLPAIAGAGDVLIALPDQPYQSALAWTQKNADETMERFLADFDTGSVLVGARVESGRPEEVILAAAREGGFDMIVMGTHGRSGLSHLILGSVAERVVRLAPCPVLTVKAHQHALDRAS